MVDKSKETYLKYRERARELFETGSDPAAENAVIRIPQHANVQVVEDGAFVEAFVWVPKEKL